MAGGRWLEHHRALHARHLRHGGLPEPFRCRQQCPDGEQLRADLQDGLAEQPPLHPGGGRLRHALHHDLVGTAAQLGGRDEQLQQHLRQRQRCPGDDGDLEDIHGSRAPGGWHAPRECAAQRAELLDGLLRQPPRAEDEPVRGGARADVRGVHQRAPPHERRLCVLRPGCPRRLHLERLGGARPQLASRLRDGDLPGLHLLRRTVAAQPAGQGGGHGHLEPGDGAAGARDCRDPGRGVPRRRLQHARLRAGPGSAGGGGLPGGR
ncbi:hypothetical protein COSO111634_34625 [Corallococcus soli]